MRAIFGGYVLPKDLKEGDEVTLLISSKVTGRSRKTGSGITYSREGLSR